MEGGPGGLRIPFHRPPGPVSRRTSRPSSRAPGRGPGANAPSSTSAAAASAQVPRRSPAGCSRGRLVPRRPAVPTTSAAGPVGRLFISSVASASSSKLPARHNRSTGPMDSSAAGSPRARGSAGTTPSVYPVDWSRFKAQGDAAVDPGATRMIWPRKLLTPGERSPAPPVLRLSRLAYAGLAVLLALYAIQLGFRYIPAPASGPGSSYPPTWHPIRARGGPRTGAGQLDDSRAREPVPIHRDRPAGRDRFRARLGDDRGQALPDRLRVRASRSSTTTTTAGSTSISRP